MEIPWPGELVNLKELNISHLGEKVQLHEDGLLKILQQLSRVHSNGGSAKKCVCVWGGAPALLAPGPTHHMYSSVR